ncbi:Kelch repeat type 1 [Corchorus olitorius]|uniref:Kelch repeat type 1 n=1 Tax=Corchorus olitorius TaxID=93759 RepID=A0A1R3GG63_9ROSI|nr:Kelch repeat type 1 [Corchorus olitorius]
MNKSIRWKMEDGEDQMVKKVLKPLEGDKNEGEKEDMLLTETDQPNNQRHSGDHSDSSLLIHQLGRDISINCLLCCSRSDYGSIASLNKGFHSLIQSGELYRLRREMGIAEHWVYFSCSLMEWEAFDPIRQRWMHLPRMTSNECFMCSDKESLAVGTELLVFGKEITSHVIYRYSILTNTWSSGMKMNTPRCLFGSASLGEIAILAGGCDPRGNILSSAELYNSETGMWETIPSMNKARKMCSGVFMDDNFYVIGGIAVGNSKQLSCGEVFDLKTKTWREIPDMFPARNGGAGATEAPAAAEAPPLVAVVNNELYAADYAQKEVRKYDKERNLWVTLGHLPERAVSMNGWGLAFRACGDRLIVIGGPRALGEGMIEVNSWVPNEGPPQWKLLARKPSGSFVYNCAVMGC